MERLGLEPHIIKVEGKGWAFEEIGQRGALKVLEERGLRTDSVLCSNDRLAIGFLAACYKQGIRVGRDDSCALRVASNDDHPFAQFTCPSLTTAAHDYDNVAGRSVETLFQLIESGGKFKTRSETLFPARLVLRIPRNLQLLTRVKFLLTPRQFTHYFLCTASKLREDKDVFEERTSCGDGINLCRNGRGPCRNDHDRNRQ